MRKRLKRKQNQSNRPESGGRVQRATKTKPDNVAKPLEENEIEGGKGPESSQDQSKLSQSESNRFGTHKSDLSYRSYQSDPSDGVWRKKAIIYDVEAVRQAV